MDNKAIYSQIPGALLPWYEKHKRDLPWRGDQDPYHIWLSEIMLQQTRVEAVKGYYARFLRALPTIRNLAEADDALLHKLWEGLGYYSRVRNLKKAAQQIVTHHNGIFPREYEKILALPGIGAYTAGAVCSIAFGQPTPAVDGNVMRVVSRLTDDETPIDSTVFKKSIQQNLAQVYPPEAGMFTQALMELGATVCGPNRKPDCANCPCAGFCKAYSNGTAEKLPVKAPKKQRKIEHHTVFILSCGDRFALQKRENKGLLAGMWQFPNVAGILDTADALRTVGEMGLQVTNIRLQLERKHIFTHIEWKMRGIYAEVAQINENLTWFTERELRDNAALPTAFRLFCDNLKNI